MIPPAWAGRLLLAGLPLLAGLLLLAGSLCVLGCDGKERALTHEDCAAVAVRLQKVWKDDATAAQLLNDKGDFAGFIADEGVRIHAAWSEECDELVGRPIAESELACLKRADTIDDVYECMPR